MNLLLLKFLFFCSIFVVESETKCLTLSRKSGYCISLRKCKSISRIVEQKPLSFINRKIFEFLRCGSDNNGPKVCCDKPEENKESDDNGCQTFWKTRGECKDTHDCPEILAIFNKEETTFDDMEKYYGEPECKSGKFGPQVCCKIVEKLSGIRKNPKNISSVHNCLTPLGDSGVCRTIFKCEETRKMLQANQSESVHKLIKEVPCGLEKKVSKVCCKLNGTKPNSNSISNNHFINHRNLRLLPHEICGPIKRVERIYGGTDASKNEFPWMALLKHTDEIEGEIAPEFHCGASLINEKYVLTAAHCITQLPPGRELHSVRFGSNIASNIVCNDSDGLCVGKYQDFKVESTRIHPEYIPETHENDIALIRLQGKVNMNSKNVRPICLPLSKTDSNYNPKNFIVTGWGKTETNEISKILKKASLPFVEWKDCEDAYGSKLSNDIFSKQICAGGIEGIDSCVGDSGGPLQAIGIYDKRNSFIQYGIVSFGSGYCGTKGLPSVYTRVADFVGWILDNMED